MTAWKSSPHPWWLAIPLLLLGCSAPKPNIVYEIVSVRVTTTPVPTRTAVASPTSTATATPTPTPTPTAPPFMVEGDPRAEMIDEPLPQNGAPCGFVDILDFPLDPPDGLGARGGGDFGTFRSRYNKFHTGEDWGLQSRSNFGSPVHSIGHGQITYAAPNGWGADQGVVIVRHVFRDRPSILSFYGHLDPPSITLQRGQCVRRGEEIGEIGRPRTPPHLHFEVRVHLPDTPGPGYWETDPTSAGWLPPSEFIWEQRLAASPGVAWVRSWDAQSLQSMGTLSDGAFAVIDRTKVSGVAIADGDLGWTVPISTTVTDGVIDAVHDQIYLADRTGSLQAIRPDGDAGADWTTAWVRDHGQAGAARLIPLPRGGLIVSAGGGILAYSEAGAAIWRQESISPIASWLIHENHLFYTTERPDAALWVVDENGPQLVADELSGQLLVQSEVLWVLESEALIRLARQGGPPERVLDLSPAYRGHRDMIGLPDGGILIAHVDLEDRRLIALNPDGSLRWERSYKALEAWQPQLIAVGDQILLILQSSRPGQGRTMIYSINLDAPRLTLLFSGGTRTPRPQETWGLAASEDLLIVNIGGGALTGISVNDEGTNIAALTAP